MDYLKLNELYHHGIKGQKWGIRNDKELTGDSPKKSSSDPDNDRLKNSALAGVKSMGKTAAIGALVTAGSVPLWHAAVTNNSGAFGIVATALTYIGSLTLTNSPIVGVVSAAVHYSKNGDNSKTKNK